MNISRIAFLSILTFVRHGVIVVGNDKTAKCVRVNEKRKEN